MDISFIIPCHDNCTALRNTLQGLTNAREFATNVNTEVILVDNNSHGSALSKLYDMYLPLIRDLYLIRRPLLDHPFALCSARNIGITLARGKTIVLLDSDCIVPSHYFAEIQEATSDNTIVVGERIFVDAETLVGTFDDSDLRRLPLVASCSNYGFCRDRRIPEIYDITHHPHPWALVHAANVAFPRSAWGPVRFDESYDGSWGYEEQDFMYRATRDCGLSYTFADKCYVYHQEHSAGDTVSASRARTNDNPNWEKISEMIPGFRQFKKEQYERFRRNQGAR